MRSIITIIQGSALAACLVAFPVAADQPLQTASGVDTHSPAVAYSPARDQYLVVYQTAFGRLEGQIRSGDGTVVSGHLPLLPSYPGVEYRNPRVTYKAHNDLWLMVAIMEDRSRPLPLIRLTVTALDADGRLVWTYDVPGVGNTVRVPDVMADGFPDDCCILIAWKESYGAIHAQQIDASGRFVGTRSEIHPDGGRFSEHAFNPRLAYQRFRDEFVVVYQRTRRGGPARLELRAVQPVSGRLGVLRSQIDLYENPRTSYGEKFSGGADIALHEDGQRYLVAWRDGIHLRAALLDRGGELAYGPTILFSDSESRGDRLAGGTPEVIVAPDYKRFLITQARAMDGVFGTDIPAWWLQGWWMDLAGRPTARTVSTWWYPEEAGSSAGGWSPTTNTAFVVWERDEPTSSIGPPPRDLYWEAASPP